MNKHQHDTWLSVHLFYNEPWEDFLQKAIEPYVNTAKQTGIAQQYFFIRYWEKGPHIRLRLKGNLDMINSILKPNLEEHFIHYFESKPSRRVEPNYPPNFSEDLKWYPNNTLEYYDYEPEFGRYGGPVGIELSEKQFMLSSQTVLEFIKQKGKTWSYDDAMGVAIKLHLTFIHAAGLGINEAISFFDFHAKNWLPYTFKKKDGQLNTASLIPFHSSLWKAMEDGNSFDEENLNNWLKENKLILEDLISKEKEGELSSRTKKYQYQFRPSQYPEKELLWSIFVDFIHMTNNRLGIFNRDESYLSFMMMRCLQEIKKNENSELEEEVVV